MSLERLRALGFSERDARILWEHFDDAERRGKLSHGHARIEWLESLDDLDPRARPERVESGSGFERWHGRGAVGYLTLAAICDAQLESPPEHARVVVAERCFPTGHLGYWVRRLARGGLVAVLTATSPARLAPPGLAAPKLAGTNPLAIGIPSSDGRPLVADVSPAKATWGDVIAGRAGESDVVPFGGEQAHKAFALALGLQLFVDALVSEPGHGAVLLVAKPAADPVPALREIAGGIHLPGDS